MRSYLQFILSDWRLLGFGLVLTLYSNVGQTFFIGLFGAELRGAFDLSHRAFGTIYAAATLCSGFLLLWAGRQIDRFDLRLFTLIVCLGLIGATFIMALVPHVVILVLAIFMLRFFGQGLLGHTAITTMARYFDANRGKAISIALFGYPIGEALLPLIAVGLIAAIGWRMTWGSIGIVLAVTLLPLVFWLLRGQSERHAALKAHHAEAASRNDAPARRSWTAGEVFRDPRFLFIMPAVLGAPLLVTGMFFHQEHIVNERGWSLTWYAACFIGFAVVQFPTSFTTGILIDRIGAGRLLPLILLPLALGLGLMALITHPWVVPVYLGLIGVTIGMIGPIVNSHWAESYGVLHIGAIRAMVSAMMVVSTAICPLVFGAMIDAGASVSQIAGGGLAYCVLTGALASAALRRSAGDDTSTMKS